MRRDRPDPLVQHVDDHALGRLRQHARELLHQHERCAQPWLDVRIPRGTVGIVPFVALERRGVVHQHANRTKRRGGTWQQCRCLCLIAEVGAQQHGPAVDLADLGARGLRGGNTGVVMQGDVEPSYASASAMARPMRCAAPVTRATRGMLGMITVIPFYGDLALMC